MAAKRAPDGETKKKNNNEDASSATSSWEEADEDVYEGGCCGRGKWRNDRAKHGEPYEPTRREHWANTLSHGLALIPCLWFGRRIIATARPVGASVLAVAVVYAFCTTVLFTASTAYHVSELRWRHRRRNRKLRRLLHLADRTAIYLFIASSYTPWLTLRREGPAFRTLGAVWALAAGGTVYQIRYHEQRRHVETALYVLCSLLPALRLFSMGGDRRGLHEMVLGGAVYLVGAVFFKLDGRVPCAHAIWHTHVVAGAAIHSHAILRHLVQPLAAAVTAGIVN